MKSIVRSILLFTTISLCGGALASNSQIDLKVKGYHNENERMLESNSILFSGDSFQLSVEALDSLHIYAFLIDSSGNVMLLNDDTSLVSKNNTVHFPSDTNNWFQLDEKIGLETLVIVSNKNSLNIDQISSSEDVYQLKEKGASLETFVIRHVGTKLAMRGLDNVGDENLIGTIDPKPKAAESFESIMNSKSSSQTILQIMDDAKGLDSMGSSTTRGVKEIRIFEDSAPAVVYIETTMGHGTGGLVSNDGLVFTNSHVVGDAKKVYVYFMPKNSGKYSKEDYKIGMVVNNNEKADLALVKLLKNPIGIKPLSLADASTIKIGQDVHAIGHPGMGSQWTYTRGYIGQILTNHEWDYNDGINRKARMVIQSQTPIMGGNSGGPLLNDNGKVIGVNSYGSDYAGANYAVSVKDLKLFLNQKYTMPKTPVKDSDAKQASYEWDANVIRVSKLDYDSDGVIDTVYFLDDDNTGIWETALIEIGSNDELVVVYDYDEDGKWNEKIINTNDNPHLDFYIFDQDGDGKADYFGYDDNEDGEIDRYEEV